MMKIISRKFMLSENPAGLNTPSYKFRDCDEKSSIRRTFATSAKIGFKVGFEGTRAQGEGLATLLMRRKPLFWQQL